MKKAAKIILCAVLVLLIAGGSITWAMLPHPLSYDIKSVKNIGSRIEVVSKEEDCVTIRNRHQGVFKVLAFTDLHLDGKNKTSETTVSYMVENIIREEPDLVIVGGDTVTSGLNKKRAAQFAEIFENLGVYWAGVLGNHEGDNKWSVTRSEMIGIFSSHEHCLMLEGPDDIWGNGNYIINLLNDDDSLCECFVFMDTGDEATAETKAEYNVETDDDIYDGVKQSQIDWYKKKMNANKEKYGGFKSIAVMHIPLPQLREAAEKGEFLYGNKQENVCSSGFDSGLFAAMKECGSTQAAFFGHDHLNDFGVRVDGILLGYLQPSGYGSYTALSRFNAPESEWLQGCTVFQIATDGSFIQEHKYNNQLHPAK